MHISITVPVGDPRRGPALFAEIEDAGYDRAFSFESDHDPFIPLAAAAATTSRLQLGTAVAIGFARNPMVLANIGHDMQLLTEGRFVLGLGSQIRPHIENRFSEVWSRPAARMKEMVSAIRAIWENWEGRAPLAFQGEFYRHTLMTPAFDPGPNEYGAPPIFVGGFGPRMVSAAGEVADGLIVHPFTSRRSMEEVTLPALDEGLRRSGRTRADVQVVWVTMLVVWDDLKQRDEMIRSAREQLAFYGSTPAYRPVLEVHGWDGLQPELNRLSKEGRWDEMTAMIPEELVDALAVVAPREQAASRLAERVAGITDHLTLVNNRHPDPGHFADVVADLRRLGH